jgi:protein-S-isoprenylcysteine O-methyltransferase Ste14
LLKERFGEEGENYSERVGFLLPKLGRRKGESTWD